MKDKMMGTPLLPSQATLVTASQTVEDNLRTLPKDGGKSGHDGKEPAKEHAAMKGNRAAKRRRKHLYKKLNQRKGFRNL